MPVAFQSSTSSAKHSASENEDGEHRGKKRRFEPKAPPSGPQPILLSVGSLFSQGDFEQTNNDNILMAGRPEVWNQGAADEVDVEFLSSGPCDDGDEEEDEANGQN